MNTALRVSYPPVPDLAGISPHGLFSALGILLGATLLARAARVHGISADLLDRALLAGVVAGVVGARADYVLVHPDDFDSAADVLRVWQGGMALFGGLIAGIAAACVVLRRGGAPVLRTLDLAALPLALAIAVGRVGDLLLTDHLGKPAGGGLLAIAYRIPAGADLAPGFGPARPPGAGESCADAGRFYSGCDYHLTPAYDLLGALALAALLAFLAHKATARGPGTTAAAFALWYGTQRLLTDFLRGTDERVVAGLSSTQLLSAALVTAAATALLRTRHRPERAADTPDPTPAKDPR